MSKPDYLSEDSLLPADQKFVCLSFLKPTKEDNTTLSGIKVRGAFESYELACNHAKKLQDIDPYHHVFVGEMGKWLPHDPDPDSKYVKDFVYANEQLNGMMKSYMENQEKAKLFHEQRKNELVRKNILDNMAIQNNTLEELKAQKSDEPNRTLEDNIKALEDQMNKMELKKKDMDAQLEQIASQLAGESRAS
jgi:hypothetical protein